MRRAQGLGGWALIDSDGVEVWSCLERLASAAAAGPLRPTMDRPAPLGTDVLAKQDPDASGLDPRTTSSGQSELPGFRLQR